MTWIKDIAPAIVAVARLDAVFDGLVAERFGALAGIILLLVTADLRLRTQPTGSLMYSRSAGHVAGIWG